MTMSVKMLNDIAAHTQALADDAQALAAAIRAVVDDCAEQLAARKDNENRREESSTPAAPSAEPAWVAEAEATVVPDPLPMGDGPAKKHTLTEVRAFVAERTRPENRAQIRAILKGFGVAKLTELPEEKYEALMSEVEKL